MYCEQCDSLLVHKTQPDNSIIFSCPDCDFTEENSELYTNTFLVSERINHSDKSKIEVVDSTSDVAITSELREELREQYRESMSSLE